MKLQDNSAHEIWVASLYENVFFTNQQKLYNTLQIEFSNECDSDELTKLKNILMAVISAKYRCHVGLKPLGKMTGSSTTLLLLCVWWE